MNKITIILYIFRYTTELLLKLKYQINLHCRQHTMDLRSRNSSADNYSLKIMHTCIINGKLLSQQMRFSRQKMDPFVIIKMCVRY